MTMQAKIYPPAPSPAGKKKVASLALLATVMLVACLAIGSNITATADDEVPPAPVFPPSTSGIVLLDEAGNFDYAITALQPAKFLDADAIIGWGTDLTSMDFVGIVQTNNPYVFVYLVDGKQAGTIRFHADGVSAITWRDNRVPERSGTAFVY